MFMLLLICHRIEYNRIVYDIYLNLHMGGLRITYRVDVRLSFFDSMYFSGNLKNSAWRLLEVGNPVTNFKLMMFANYENKIV